MKRAILGAIFVSGAGCLAFGQPAEAPPKFEIADVHGSAKTQNPFGRSMPVHNGRYEIKTATMVDLVRFAYGFDADKILGGPSWLEMNHYDVVAKVPPDTTPETQKLMLQALLAERFKLVTHQETKPLPAYALVAGKKPQLKQADGTESSGCKPQESSGPPPEGGSRLMMSTNNGGVNSILTINLGPGNLIQYNCRNMTMAAFAQNLRGMFGANLGSNPVTDETGLKGNWNFDIKYSFGLIGPLNPNTADRVTIFEAVDKQLGLKLEERQVPTPVIVVESVNEKPTPNSPEVAEALPPIPVPTEFEVASIKVSEPPANGMMMSRSQIQPGGRVIMDGQNLRSLVSRALNANFPDQIVGLPAFADSVRFDITAKAASVGPSAPQMDMESVAPMLRSLLVDRFKMTYHTEERQLNGYALVGSKSKMKKADPASRASCKNGNAPPGAPPATRVLTCQNVTMEQFADRLQGLTGDLRAPVLNATEVEGNWDFTLTFSMAPMIFAGGGRGGDGPQPANAGLSASDPTGGYTIFEAIEKQLGLKLEMQKRPMSVYVIDHIEQKPTEN